MEDLFEELHESVIEHDDLEICVSDRSKSKSNPHGWCIEESPGMEWRPAMWGVIVEGPFVDSSRCWTNGKIYCRRPNGSWTKKRSVKALSYSDLPSPDPFICSSGWIIPGPKLDKM